MAKELSDKKAQKNIAFRKYFPRIISLNIPLSNTKGYSLDHENFTFEVNVGNQVSFEKNQLSIFITFKIYPIDSKEKILSEIIILNDFLIENLKSHLVNEADNANPKFHKLFLATLLGISLSTGRGLIISKLEGIFKHPPILPIMNPLDLIKE